MNITDLVQVLHGSILAQNIVFSEIPNQPEIVMVDTDTTAAQGQIYLAFPESLYRFLASAEVPVTVLTCDSRQVIPNVWKSHNIIQTNLKINTLYNAVCHWVQSKASGSSIASLMECSDSVTAKRLAAQLVYPFPSVPCWITVNLPNHADLTSVTKVFPSWNMQLIGHQLWMLGTDEPCVIDALSNLMQELHTVCCIGIPMCNFSMISALAHITQDVLQLAMEQASSTPDASPQAAVGVYRVQDEIPTLLCRYASLQMRTSYGDSALESMVHPLVKRLYEYDADHETDLAFFLFQFLLSGNNVTVTADTLHIHRNTAYNWLRIIQQMQDITKISGYEHFWMLLSCIIMNYLWQNEGIQLPKTLRLHGALSWFK